MTRGIVPGKYPKDNIVLTIGLRRLFDDRANYYLRIQGHGYSSSDPRTDGKPNEEVEEGLEKLWKEIDAELRGILPEEAELNFIKT